MPSKEWWIRRRLRDRFMKRISFVSFPAARGYRVHPIPVVVDRENVKTKAMLRLEKEHWRSIEFLLLGDKPEVVADKLGITPSRVRNWLTYLRLQWTKDALPSCSGCQWKVAACDPKVDTVQYPLECRLLKLTKQDDLHEIKVRQLKGQA